MWCILQYNKLHDSPHCLMKPQPFPPFHFHSTFSSFKLVFYLKYLLTSKFQMHSMPKFRTKKEAQAHTKITQRKSEEQLNWTTHVHSHTRTQFVYTFDWLAIQSRADGTTHFSTAFSFVWFFILCSIAIHYWAFSAQKNAVNLQRRKKNGNRIWTTHTRPIFICVFSAPLFIFMKKDEIFLLKIKFNLIVHQNKVKKHSHRSGKRELRTSE